MKPIIASKSSEKLGRKGKTDSDIKRGDFGWVAIDGDVWKSRLADNATADIPKGTIVEVTARDSIILTVREINS